MSLKVILTFCFLFALWADVESAKRYRINDPLKQHAESCWTSTLDYKSEDFSLAENPLMDYPIGLWNENTTVKAIGTFEQYTGTGGYWRSTELIFDNYEGGGSYRVNHHWNYSNWALKQETEIWIWLRYHLGSYEIYSGAKAYSDMACSCAHADFIFTHIEIDNRRNEWPLPDANLIETGKNV